MPTDNEPGTATAPLPPPLSGLTVETRHPDARAAVCSLAGDLDTGTLAPAQESLAALVGQRPAVLVVDLAEVAFCDSSGLNLLLKTRLAAAGAGTELRLAAVPPMVMRVLELTGAHLVFSLHSSVRAALAA